MGNTVQLTKNGQPVFPVTDVSLVMGLQDAIKLPPIKVTTLPTASADTAGKMYYVGPDANDEYERYITSATNGSYEWIDLGDTSIPLPSIADNETTNDANTAHSAAGGKRLNDKLGQLEAKVDENATAVKQDLGQKITLVETEAQFTVVPDNYVIAATGAFSSSVNNDVVVIDVSTSKRVRFIGVRFTTPATSGFAFYDENGVFISGTPCDGNASQRELGEYILTVPDGAVTFKATRNKAYYQPSDYYYYLQSGDNVSDGLDKLADEDAALAEDIKHLDAEIYGMNETVEFDSADYYINKNTYIPASTTSSFKAIYAYKGCRLFGKGVGSSTAVISKSKVSLAGKTNAEIATLLSGTSNIVILVANNTGAADNDTTYEYFAEDDGWYLLSGFVSSFVGGVEYLGLKANVIGDEFSADDKALSQGRNKIVDVPLKKGHTLKITLDVVGAVSRVGNLYTGWYNGNTETSINPPDSAKPVLYAPESHIVFFFTPEEDYPNGLLGVSNWSYDSENIQYATVLIEEYTHDVRISDLEKKQGELSDEINGVSIFTFNPDVIVRQRLSQLVKATRQGASVVPSSIVSFLHFSDLHGQTENLKRIIDFAGKYGEYLDDVLASGDQIYAYIGDSFAFWNEAGAEKVLLAIGNHETWQTENPGGEDNPASETDCYVKYFGDIQEWNVVSPGVNKCYYYKDYNTDGSYPLRLIVIDCMHINEDQTSWFTSVLADANTNGMTVVIMSHYSPSTMPNVVFDDDSTFTCLEGPRDLTTAATVVPFEAIVKNFIDGGGKFACWLVGHKHWDFFGLSEHGQPIVCVECACTTRTDRYDARVVGTKTQDSFNIISFDTYKGIFRIARIGNDMDRYMRPKETLCYDYVNKVGIFNS